MRLAIPAVAMLLLGAPTTEAPAQDFGRILRPVVRPVTSLLRHGARKVLRPHAYRARARAAARARTAAPARAAQTQDQTSQQQMPRGQVVQPKPFWPSATQDIFDYVLSANGSGLWGHGYGAIVVSMFTQPPKTADSRGSIPFATLENGRQTTGTAPAGGAGMICGERDTNRAEEVTKQLAETLALADGQQDALAELRSALERADDEAMAACPRDLPAGVPERLRTMQDRLWAVRVMTSSLRGPLQKFHAALTDEQKAKFDARAGTGEAGKEAAMQCYMMTKAAPQWPAAQIGRVVRPNKEQQARLGALAEMSSQMGQLMMGACPKTTPEALARLDAAVDWIDSVLFAGVNMAVVVDDFYRSLSEEQRAKLDRIDL